jgi:hypothetical protein
MIPDAATPGPPGGKPGPKSRRSNLSPGGSDKSTPASETATLQLTIRKQLAKVKS